MSLTVGRAPFARPPAGQFNFTLAAPKRVLYFEDCPRRVRGVLNGHTVPLAEAAKIKGLLAFYNERVELEVDGERLDHT